MYYPHLQSTCRKIYCEGFLFLKLFLLILWLQVTRQDSPNRNSPGDTILMSHQNFKNQYKQSSSLNMCLFNYYCSHWCWCYYEWNFFYWGRVVWRCCCCLHQLWNRNLSFLFCFEGIVWRQLNQLRSLTPLIIKVQIWICYLRHQSYLAVDKSVTSRC